MIGKEGLIDIHELGKGRPRLEWPEESEESVYHRTMPHRQRSLLRSNRAASAYSTLHSGEGDATTLPGAVSRPRHPFAAPSAILPTAYSALRTRYPAPCTVVAVSLNSSKIRSSTWNFPILPNAYSELCTPYSVLRSMHLRTRLAITGGLAIRRKFELCPWNFPWNFPKFPCDGFPSLPSASKIEAVFPPISLAAARRRIDS